MAGKTGKMVSLEAIEEHLKRQDKEIDQSNLVTIVAFGGTVVLMGASLLYQRFIAITILDIVFPFVLGAILVGGAWWWASKIAKKQAVNQIFPISYLSICEQM